MSERISRNQKMRGKELLGFWELMSWREKAKASEFESEMV